MWGFDEYLNSFLFCFLCFELEFSNLVYIYSCWWDVGYKDGGGEVIDKLENFFELIVFIFFLVWLFIRIVRG